MKQENIILKIGGFVIDLAFVIAMIVHFIIGPEYTAQLTSLFMVLAGAIKVIFYLATAHYRNVLRLHDVISNGLLIILGFIFMLAKVDAIAVCLTYGIIDALDGACGIICTSFEIKHNRLVLVETALSVGDIVFGTLLCFEHLHGVKMHLIFLTITMFAYLVVEIIEMIIEKKKEEKIEGENE